MLLVLVDLAIVGQEHRPSDMASCGHQGALFRGGGQRPLGQLFQLEELAEGALPSTPEEGALVPATCHVTRAMLLTHDCEIDKDKKHRTVALIRPLPTNAPVQDRATLQKDRKS